MLRILLWFMILYILWKVVRVVTSMKRYREMQREERNREHNIPSFSNVADAEFEDLSPADSTSSKSPDQP